MYKKHGSTFFIKFYTLSAKANSLFEPTWSPIFLLPFPKPSIFIWCSSILFKQPDSKWQKTLYSLSLLFELSFWCIVTRSLCVCWIFRLSLWTMSLATIPHDYYFKPIKWGWNWTGHLIRIWIGTNIEKHKINVTMEGLPLETFIYSGSLINCEKSLWCFCY